MIHAPNRMNAALIIWPVTIQPIDSGTTSKRVRAIKIDSAMIATTRGVPMAIRMISSSGDSVTSAFFFSHRITI